MTKIRKNSKCSDVYSIVAKLLSKVPSDFTLFYISTRGQHGNCIRADDILPNDSNVVFTDDVMCELGGDSGLGVLVLPTLPTFHKWVADSDRDRRNEAGSIKTDKLNCYVRLRTSYHALIFVKRFDIKFDVKYRVDRLKYCGYIHVHYTAVKGSKLKDWMSGILKLCGVSIRRYGVNEETYDNDLRSLDVTMTLDDLNIVSGDILVIETSGGNDRCVTSLMCFMIEVRWKVFSLCSMKKDECSMRLISNNII